MSGTSGELKLAYYEKWLIMYFLSCLCPNIFAQFYIPTPQGLLWVILEVESNKLMHPQSEKNWIELLGQIPDD